MGKLVQKMLIVFKPVMFEDFTHQKRELKNCYQSKNILQSRKTAFPSLYQVTYFIRKTTRISSNYINYLENRKPAQFLPRKHKHSAFQRVDFGRVIWTEITFLTYFRCPQLYRGCTVTRHLVRTMQSLILLSCTHTGISLIKTFSECFKITFEDSTIKEYQY